MQKAPHYKTNKILTEVALLLLRVAYSVIDFVYLYIW